GDEIALDMNGNSVVSSYTHGNKLIQSSAYGWYLYNAHGDVVQLADDSGAVTHDYEYDPFGNERVSNASENPYRFCGEYYDVESGYVYLRARYYDPELGRFVNEDPALDGDNWYVYCGNDPVNNVDPSGLLAFPAQIHNQVVACGRSRL
ncbi:MAG: RHS repeat-associated core domain-containing protein, partial [Oscillospiraceae bacterium]|nr:RHS repeat-associated core domain-containing protein [Oscillospiraceae bacterium]